MSLILKTDPKGIDVVINNLQNTLFTELTTEFGWTDYQSYPRAYKNPKDGSLIPENYDGSGDYKEVFYDDKFKATSFFLASDTSSLDRTSRQYSNTISAIFQVNLKELLPLITHRADEEMHRQVWLAITKSPQTYLLDSIVTGVDNVYSGLNLTQLQIDDMSDCHVVRFDFNITYEFEC